ncbi:MAG: citrate/2-methylcitrate synthase [Pseudomonadota bacterium]
MTGALLTAEEAAAELNVSRATLYAYVSRGMIRSEPRAHSRKRLYSAEDVRRLIDGRQRNDIATDKTQTGALPVLESAITDIGSGGFRYRGRDVAGLAKAASLESVAGLVWSVSSDPFAEAAPRWPAEVSESQRLAISDDPLLHCQSMLPVIGQNDVSSLNRSPDGLRNTGARLVRSLTALIVGAHPSSQPVHRQLANAWSTDEDDLLRAALVVSADHELNASTLAVRVVISTDASLYAGVTAGLAALSGPRHGGMTDRVAALLPYLLAAPDPEAAIAERLRRGDPLPGFGHPLYPDGDPRAPILIDLMRPCFVGDPQFETALALSQAAIELADRPPTIDFALTLLALMLALPPRAPLGLFAIGRAVGWIGHAMEQIADGRLIRPRARYVGLHP